MTAATGITGIYVIGGKSPESPVARHGVETLRAACGRLVVVLSGPHRPDWLEGCRPDAVLIEPRAEASYLAGLRRGLLAELERDPHPTGPLLATGAHVLAPIGPLSDLLESVASGREALFAPYWHNIALDTRTRGKSLPERVPYLDFAIFSPALLADPQLRGFWEAVQGTDFWPDLIGILAPFARLLEAQGHAVRYPLPPDALGTADPRLFEVHRLVEGGAPAIPLSVLSLDPLLHDIHAIALRPAIDSLRARDPAAYGALIAHAMRHMPLREFAATAEQLEILPLAAENPDKRHWRFGTVAVFIHAYYPEMIADLAARAENIPAPHHLFVTTASEENRAAIECHLLERGYARDAIDVRVVEQNRGRDMSSLFITFRDVILSDRYEVALRLHSKRTPQVSARAAEEFRSHLFDNLVPGPGYVANLLDRMEAEPDIGLMMPPLIHIGFATLGHAWFNNRARVQALLREMGIEVPLDHATPVAPNGTMYWFRTAALRRMFEHPWAWEDYNKEPHHVDGGLAHAQERLIGYCVQGAGFRVVQVMNPKAAARNYAKLEYKLQRLASHLSTGNVVEQDALLAAERNTWRGRAFFLLREIYGRTLVRFPTARKPLRPVAKAVQKLLATRF